MTIQALGGIVPMPEDFEGLSTSFVNSLIDGTGEKFAVIFQVPKSGSIRYVGFRVGTLTTSQTLNVGIQATSAGDATGSAYGGMVAGTQASPAANTFYTVTLGTDATATIGDIVAAVIGWDGTVGNLNLSSLNNTGGQAFRGFPYSSLFTTVWTRNASVPVLTIGYSDGTYYHISAMPAAAFTTTAFNSGSTPDEYALRFNLPVPLRIVGAWANMDIDNAADLVLYEGTTAQRTISLISTERAGTSAADHRYWFTSPFTTAANTSYHLALKPTTTSNVGLTQMTAPSNAALGQLGLGINAYQATRTDAGAWSTDTAVRPWMGLLVDGVDDGAGGGVGPRILTPVAGSSYF